MREYIDAIRDYVQKDYRGMLREAGGELPYAFMTPGSKDYDDVLWDWDSWLTNIAVKQILAEAGEAPDACREYERGCILNFLHYTDDDGYMPISIKRGDMDKRPEDIYHNNMHKPVLAQHAAFLVRYDGGDADWLRESFYKLEAHIGNYLTHHRHEPTGLMYLQTDVMTVGDNDPCSFYRPYGSCASIFLNCAMIRELEAMAYLCGCLGLDEQKKYYENQQEALVTAVREHCYDERDGFYYSVDINLRPVDFSHGEYYHKGAPRHWHCLIQRIGVWSGFMAMWAGVATQQQADRMVKEHFRNEKTFSCKGGVRSLSKLEKMYLVAPTSNPSCWLGPVWGIVNYLVFRGLLQYGYQQDARELCRKTIALFGSDVQKNGAFHEFYDPDTCEPVYNIGFQSWNLLTLNMIVWYEGGEPITEF